MEMCYDGALVMPNNYAVVSEEEMTYVDGGGWSSYYGIEAIGMITAIAGCAVSTAVIAGKASKLCETLASIPSPAAWIAAIGVALAIPVLVGFTFVQSAYVFLAATYMIESYKNTRSFWQSGFQASTYSVWQFTVCTSVASL